jgi:hypothetical protein
MNAPRPTVAYELGWLANLSLTGRASVRGEKTEFDPIVNAAIDAFDDVVPEYLVSICALRFIQDDDIAVGEEMLGPSPFWIPASKGSSKADPPILILKVVQVGLLHR